MLIGKDTRISGDMLESALIAGITSAGIDVVQLGIIPTPGVAYLTNIKEVIGSVMISASHNPIADNGIKFFGQKGYKFTDEMETDIENLIFNRFNEISSPTHEEIGICEHDNSLVKQYIEHLINTVESNFSNIKLVLDCANGAAYQTAPAVIKQLGAEAIVINDKADGKKINVKSGSTYPKLVKKKVLETEADLGIAHDGDADRVILIDEKGNIINGDKIMAILSMYMLENKMLNKNTLVTTRYSNLGLKEMVEKRGGNVVTAKNGDRYVLKEMLNNNYNLGGEQSGHIIMLDYNTTGDGILTAIKVMEVMNKTGKSLNSLSKKMKEWPQKLSNVKVKNKQLWKDNKEINDVITEAEKDFGDTGRVFVRASGTEPVIRVMLEGKDKTKLNNWEERITSVISNELN